MLIAAPLFIYKIAIKRWEKEASCFRFIKQSHTIGMKIDQKRRKEMERKKK